MSKLLSSLSLLAVVFSVAAQNPLNDTAGPSVAWPLEVIEEVLTPCLTVPQVRIKRIQQEKGANRSRPCMPPARAPTRASGPRISASARTIPNAATGERAAAIGRWAGGRVRASSNRLARVRLPPAAPPSRVLPTARATARNLPQAPAERQLCASEHARARRS
jgi:hypothetical protein